MFLTCHVAAPSLVKNTWRGQTRRQDDVVEGRWSVQLQNSDVVLLSVWVVAVWREEDVISAAWWRFSCVYIDEMLIVGFMDISVNMLL